MSLVKGLVQSLVYTRKCCPELSSVAFLNLLEVLSEYYFIGLSWKDSINIPKYENNELVSGFTSCFALK